MNLSLSVVLRTSSAINIERILYIIAQNIEQRYRNVTKIANFKLIAVNPKELLT